MRKRKKKVNYSLAEIAMLYLHTKKKKTLKLISCFSCQLKKQKVKKNENSKFVINIVFLIYTQYVQK